jgi:peptidoglycan/LPS O-acetylase OafA/YrhL
LGSHELPTLDGLRAISIGCVLGAHLLPLGPKALRLNETAGAMGMSLFFALSGFLIVRALSSTPVGAFVVKRLARILPLAYLYVAVVFLLFWQRRDQLLAELFFTLNYQQDQMIPQTEHLWSLCVEVHFYVFVAFLAALGRTYLAFVWPCCLAVTALRIAYGVPISILTHLRIDEILAGACLALLIGGARANAAPQLNTRAALALWCAAAAAWVVASHPGSGALQYVRPYGAALLMAATLALPRCGLATLLASAPLRYVAAISYALYIMHPLTAHGWWKAGGLAERYLVKRPLSLMLTLVASHLSTFHWERWWIAQAKRWTQRTTAASTVLHPQELSGRRP